MCDPPQPCDARAVCGHWSARMAGHAWLNQRSLCALCVAAMQVRSVGVQVVAVALRLLMSHRLVSVCADGVGTINEPALPISMRFDVKLCRRGVVPELPRP